MPLTLPSLDLPIILPIVILTITGLVVLLLDQFVSDAGRGWNAYAALAGVEALKLGKGSAPDLLAVADAHAAGLRPGGVHVIAPFVHGLGATWGSAATRVFLPMGRA